MIASLAYHGFDFGKNLLFSQNVSILTKIGFTVDVNQEWSLRQIIVFYVIDVMVSDCDRSRHPQH